MAYATLTDRSLITLRGLPALSFLQGLVTNDVLKLPEKQIVYTAMLTPQGKFLHDFFVMQGSDSVLIDCPAARRDELVQRLKRYRLRTAVEIEANDALAITALWDEEPKSESGVLLYRDPRVAALGWRMVGNQVPAGTQVDYNAHRIALAVPQGDDDLIPEKSFILPFGFEALHGVDFTKGCYVGQEVTARSKHLGSLRKFIYKVEATSYLPAPGAAVKLGDLTIGELRSSQGNTGLALLSVEDVAKGPLQCAGIELKATVPAWSSPPH